MNLAKAVANAAAMLVLKAKNVAQVAEDTVLQNRVIAAATQCALSTSQLVACAKVQGCVWVISVTTHYHKRSINPLLPHKHQTPCNSVNPTSPVNIPYHKSVFSCGFQLDGHM